MLVLAMEFSRGGQRPHNAANRSKRPALKVGIAANGSDAPRKRNRESPTQRNLHTGEVHLPPSVDLEEPNS